MTTDVRYVDLTKRYQLKSLHRFEGLVEAENALDEAASDMRKLPGFGLAKALVAVKLEQYKSQFYQTMLRATAAAGIDISKTSKVSLESTENGKARIVVTMMDLADIAAEAEAEGD